MLLNEDLGGFMHFPILTIPTCPKCGASTFGIKEIQVQDANFRHYAILCTSCGCVVGTETMQDDERVNQLQNTLLRIEGQLTNIKNALQRHGIY